ncbi:MAG: hypothetical protein M3324_06495, partial [Actinomycetota bacterium]|nr:hypothetical protein [Actinomycetota bacterium]
TAGCIDTDLPTGRRNFGQSDKPLIEIAHVHHAMWVTFTETRCSGGLLIQEKEPDCAPGEPDYVVRFSRFMGIEQAHLEPSSLPYPASTNHR